MDLNRLEKLKEMIVSAESFGDPWDYFFTHFGEKPEFMTIGSPTEHPVLQAVIEKLGQEIEKDAPASTPSKPMLVKIEAQNFIHGSFFVQGRMGMLIFFEDIDMGLMSVSAGGPDASTLMMRFSTYMVDGDKAVQPNPGLDKDVN